MAKKGDRRKIIGMVSEESGERIYYTSKNMQNTPDKLSLRKYSPKLQKHVVFTETKKNLGRNEVKPVITSSTPSGENVICGLISDIMQQILQL